MPGFAASSALMQRASWLNKRRRAQSENEQNARFAADKRPAELFRDARVIHCRPSLRGKCVAKEPTQ